MQLKIILQRFSGETASVLYDDFSLEDQVNKNIKFIYSEKREGHKILRNLHCRVVLYSKYNGQIFGRDFENVFAFSEYMKFNNDYGLLKRWTFFSPTSIRGSF